MYRHLKSILSLNLRPAILFQILTNMVNVTVLTDWPLGIKYPISKNLIHQPFYLRFNLSAPNFTFTL